MNELSRQAVRTASQTVARNRWYKPLFSVSRKGLEVIWRHTLQKAFGAGVLAVPLVALDSYEACGPIAHDPRDPGCVEGAKA